MPIAMPIKVLAFMEATVVNGAAKSLLNFCDTVAAWAPESRPVAITIATFHRGEIPEGRPANAFIEAVQSRGIPILVIPERYRFDPQSLTALREQVNAASPDLMQTNNVKSHAMIKMTGLQRRYPWIAFHHGYTAPDFKMRLYNQLDRWSLPAAHRIVAVCGPFREQLVAMGIPGNHIRVLHNSAAVLPDDYRTGLAKPYTDGRKTLLAIGRLSSEKGHADLLRALARLRSSRPDLPWKLLLVGSGHEEQNLKSLTSELQLESQVIFASQQNDVLPFYAAAHAMVLPSHTEGSPHVVLEAMSAGVPIIATNVGGVPEILENQNTAILVPPHDPDAMATAIARLLDSPENARQLAENAKQVLRDHFSHQAYAQSLIEIYRDLLRSSAGAPERKLA